MSLEKRLENDELELEDLSVDELESYAAHERTDGAIRFLVYEFSIRGLNAYKNAIIKEYNNG